MSEPLRSVAERIARTTDRRGLFGKGAQVLFATLAGTAAGAALQRGVSGLPGTVCSFPSTRPCPCDKCQQNGVCAKPCHILTTFYAAGCWVDDGYTCCDCLCSEEFPGTNGWCGCGSDYHNDPAFCPN
jgi:hypothetical protein